MAPCCTNTVTPTMIKKGQMQIGDKIQIDDNYEDVLVSSQDEYLGSEAETINVQAPVYGSSQSEVSESADTQVQETIQQSVQMPQQFQQPAQMPQQFQQPAQMPQQFQQPAQMPQQFQQPQMQQQTQPQSQQMQQIPNTQSNMRDGLFTLSSISESITEPLTYSQMTPYMNHVSTSPSQTGPNITIPQTPMTTENYEETIDTNDVQAYVGFLRTQIGRYMRIEQLIGSNLIEDRFGFLVGVGSNFIILQEITSGNIMVIDLFSIRFTYIYYSEPVFPRL